MAIPRRPAIVYSNLADAATVTASSQLADAAAAMVQQQDVAVQWLAAGTAASITFDHGADIALDSFSLHGCTGDTARVRVALAADPTFAAPAFDSGVTAIDSHYLQATWLREAAATGRYVKYDLAGSGPRVGIGRAVHGVRSTFSAGMAFGAGVQHADDMTRRERTPSRQTRIAPERTFRVYTAPFEFMSAADRDGFVETIARGGLKSDLLFIASPWATGAQLVRDTIFGLPTEAMSIMQAVFGVYSFTLTTEERG